MRKYKSSNHVPAMGTFLLLGTAVLGGLVIGGLAGVIDQFIYLILLFPLVMGGVGGFLLTLAVGKGKVRNPLVAGAVGLLMGLVIYGTFNFVGYLFFRQQIREEITVIAAEEGETLTEEELEYFPDEFLMFTTGSTGFWGYIQLIAQEGMSIGRVASSSEINIGSTLTWIYWLIELVIITGAAASLAYQRANEPFCEDCDNWYESKMYVGGSHIEDKNGVLTLAEEEQFEMLKSRLKAGTANPSVDVYIRSCAECTHQDSMLFIETNSVDSRGRTKNKLLAKGLISPSQKEILMAREIQI